VARLLGSTSFRLASFYAALFGISTIALFGIIYSISTEALRQQLTAGVQSEVVNLSEEYRTGGSDQAVARIARRISSGRYADRFYLLQDSRGRRLAGNLPPMAPRDGWIELAVPAGDRSDEPDLPDEGSERRLLGLGRVLSDGTFLFVAEDTERISEAKEAIVRAFAWGIAGTLVLAALGGAVLSAALLKRLDAINRTSRAIVEGNLADRVPTRGTDDELDRLAANLNEMLDRIQSLMQTVRHVSNDIAHDLRTPLGRLRHRLEEARATATSVAAYESAIERALADVDELLEMFSALLRIAQIEAGTRRAAFAAVDLSGLFLELAEAYGPVADDRRQRLRADVAEGIAYRGDRQLLVQMLANVLENALRHTPEGATITLSLARTPEGTVGVLADDGPGIPDHARAKVFQPFFRLEASRNTPGSGLGLALVAAIADLHRIRVELAGNHPGLKVVLRFGRDHLPIAPQSASQ
jgi:signal transduction histidine kinase